MKAIIFYRLDPCTSQFDNKWSKGNAKLSLGSDSEILLVQ